VARMLSQTHLVIRPPGFQLERAAARERLMIQPAIPVLVDALARNDRERGVATKLEEESERGIEFHSQCVFVEGADSNLVRISQFAEIKWLGVFDVKELAGIISGSSWAQSPQPGVNHIRRGDRFAGRP